jgi:hypothetical protein
MSSHLDADHAGPAATKPSRSMRTGVTSLTGALVGVLVGVVIEAAVWLYAFSSALNGTAMNVPFIVTASSSGDDVIARSGAGVLILPLALLLVGAVLGAVVGVRSRRAAQ